MMASGQERARMVQRSAPLDFWRDKVVPKYALLVKHINPAHMLPFLSTSLSTSDIEEIRCQQSNGGPRYAAQVLLYNLARRPQPQGFRDLMSALIDPDIGLANIAMEIDYDFAEFIAREKGVNLADYIEEDSDDETYLRTLRANATGGTSPQLLSPNLIPVSPVTNITNNNYVQIGDNNQMMREDRSISPDSLGSSVNSEDANSTMAPSIEYSVVEETSSSSDTTELTPQPSEDSGHFEDTSDADNNATLVTKEKSAKNKDQPGKETTEDKKVPPGTSIEQDNASSENRDTLDGTENTEAKQRAADYSNPAIKEETTCKQSDPPSSSRSSQGLSFPTFPTQVSEESTPPPPKNTINNDEAMASVASSYQSMQSRESWDESDDSFNVSVSTINDNSVVDVNQFALKVGSEEKREVTEKTNACDTKFENEHNTTSVSVSAKMPTDITKEEASLPSDHPRKYSEYWPKVAAVVGVVCGSILLICYLKRKS